MKPIIRSLLLLPAIAFLAFTLVNEPLPIGSDIPKANLQLKNYSGKDVSLKSAMEENGLLVMFSCNTCPVVISNQTRTKEISQYALSNKVGVMLLNSNEGNRGGKESLEAMKTYAKDQAYNWIYAVDKNSELANAFGANRTPECFLFNKQGKLVYHGAIDDSPQNESNISRKHLKEAINEMTNGKDVSVKKSRSVGCAIKRL